MVKKQAEPVCSSHKFREMIRFTDLFHKKIYFCWIVEPGLIILVPTG